MGKKTQAKKVTRVRTKTKHCPLARDQRKIRNIAENTGCTLAEAKETWMAQRSKT